jgi:hypothetical protein
VLQFEDLTPRRLVNRHGRFGQSCIHLIIVSFLKTALKIEAEMPRNVGNYKSARWHVPQVLRIYQHCSDNVASITVIYYERTGSHLWAQLSDLQNLHADVSTLHVAIVNQVYTTLRRRLLA